MEQNKISWPGWETVGLIGRGSFGAVYEIQRDVFGEIEKAALKVISIPQNDSDIEEMYNDGYDDESITSTFQSHLKSIVAEYSLMRKMNGHTNIVSCDDMRYIQHDNGVGWDIFIKMELLTPLAKALPNEITEDEAVRVAKDLCAALELCSKHSIVHRDIKPQNIFVSEHGDYKLGDFGIAKTVEKTMGGTKIGTYKYMAPEVYNNQPYGHGADIYSLGLVLYWLLNERRMPFLPLPPAKLKAGMEEEARERRLRGEPLPAPAHGSKALQAIVLKACAYDPAERYHTAEEMLQDLEKLGAKPAMPELVSAAELAPKAAPVSAPAAPEQKPVSGFEPMAKTSAPAPQPAAPSAPAAPASTPELEPVVKLSATAQSYRAHYQQQYEKPQPKTREQIAEEYRRNYQAQQEKQAKAEAAPAESDKKKKKLWPIFVAAAIVVLLLVILLPKACSNRPQTPNLPPHISSDNIPQNTQGQNQQQTAEVVSVSLRGAPTGGYIVGSKLDTANMVLCLTYSDGTTTNISDDYYLCNPRELNVLGTQVITVSFQGHTATFTVEVYDETGNTGNQSGQEPTQEPTQEQQSAQQQPVTLSSILVQSMPNKTQYYYHERLDTTGLSIKLIYSDGTTTTVSNGFSCTPKRWEDFGDQKITVTYEGKQTNFTVNVKRDTILSATIYHQPNKTVFLRGEPFSTEGLMLETKLESGGTMLWDYYDYFDFYGSLPDMHQVGTHTVFVGIDGTTTGYNVADGAYVTYEINVSDDLFVYINGHTSYDVTLDRSNPSEVDANGNPYWEIPLPTCETYSASGEEFSYEWQLISWETNGYNNPYVQGNSLIVRDKTLDSCYMVLRAVTYAYGYEYHSADVKYIIRFR